jgi:osomolarity two-component system, response regulator SKN7
MNDVLPKPFTKEGMLRALEKHLAHFKRDYIPQQQVQQQDQFGNPNPNMNINMSHIPATHSLKEEPSPAKSGSPSTSSWNSPTTMGTSPTQQSNQGYVQMQSNQGGQYMMTQTHGNVGGGYQTQPPAPAISSHSGSSGPQRRGISELGVSPEETPEKRQRMYPPPPGGFTQ